MTVSIGYSAVAAQGLTALPHLFAFATVLLASFTSDRLRTRSLPIVAVAVMAMTGYIVLSLASALNLPHILRYLCLFPITAGFFSAVTLIITWTLDNQQSSEGKGTGVVLINIIGQVGSFFGTSIYPIEDAPFYVKGHALCAGFMALVACLALGLRWVLNRANRATGVAEYARLDGEAEAAMLAGRDSGARDKGGTDFKYML